MAGRTIVVKKRPPIAANYIEAISEHFQSRKEEQATVKHYPEWDEIRGEPLIELTRARRELLTADEELQAKRQEYQARRRLAEQQWRGLREKEQELHASFVQFDEFVRENREKRERAERKIHNERDRQKIREAEIVELERNLDYMEKVRDKMKKYVELYKPFQSYLELVLESKEFQSIAGIFNRYEALIAARQSLEEHQDFNLHTLESTSAQLLRMTEEKSQSLMDLNNRLAQLQSRHERARTKALHWEAMVSRIKEVSAQKELEERQVRACIWNLYRQICRRKDVPVEASRSELEKQLHHIKSTIVELGKIVSAAKRKAARERREKVATIKGEPKNDEPNSTVKLDEVRNSFRSSFVSTMDFDARSLKRN